jgi:putative serine protease PepD
MTPSQHPNPNPTPTPTPARRTSRAIGLVLASLLLVAGCGTSATGSASPATGSAGPSPTASSSAGIAGALQADFINETSSGLGSGIVFDAQGDIVTNNHVVAGSTTFTVTLADGTKLPGTLVGTYPAGDIAVIHVTGTNLRPATFADSSKLLVGDIVLAVGNPLGLQSSVTQGIVSAVGRTVPESSTVTLSDAIQTSAEINPGNSGGALVDLAGNVVGIPTLGALDPQLGGGAAPGIGFAISSNVAVDAATQLIASGHVMTPPSALTVLK